MKHLIPIALLLFVCWGCNNPKQDQKEVPASTTDTAKVEIPQDEDGLNLQDSIKATGRQILVFLKEKNYTELVKYFSSEGVRFSPYGFIDTLKSKKLTPEDFLESINKKWILTWGNYDGTGDPIKLSVSNYLNKFVYNADYLNAEATGFDQVMKQGNTVNNLNTIYHNHHFIDYHFSGFEQKNNGQDWTSLRLVFEKTDGQYFLVAVTHDQWTI